MNTKQTEPFLVRLMMAAVFLPVVISCWSLIYLIAWESGYLNSDAPTSHVTVFGIPVVLFTVIVMVIVPTLCWLLILWRGWWRPALILLTVNFTVGFFITMPSSDFERVRPDKRMIKIDRNIPTGANVYCNGVLLGQVPLSLTVTDFKARVPEWTTPPEQTWFVDGKFPIYTWYPWDRFERDRYEEYCFLDTGKSPLDFDTAGKYWWKIEHNGATGCLYNRRMENLAPDASWFDRLLAYSWDYNDSLIIPVKKAIIDILLESYDLLDDQEKTIWAEYFNTLPTEWYWDFSRNNDSYREGKYDEMMDLVARVKYGFEKNPSQEKCRELLERIIAENRKSRAIDVMMSDYYVSGVGHGANGIVPARALSQLGDNAVEPIRQLLRRHWYDESGDASAVLLSALPETGTPELFDDLVRYYAMSDRTLYTFFAQDDERMLPLFHSVMDNRRLAFLVSKNIDANAKIKAMSSIYNKSLEPHIRDKIVQLVRKNRDNIWGIKDSLTTFIEARSRRLSEEERREELQRWVESLPIDPNTRRELLSACDVKVLLNAGQTGFQTATMSGGYVPSSQSGFGFVHGKWQSIIFISGEKPITTAMLLDWLQKHPDKGIEDYFMELIPKSAEGYSHLVVFALQALVGDLSPEAETVLKEYWNDPDKKETMMNTMRSIFLAIPAIPRGGESELTPGFYYDLLDWTGFQRQNINPAVLEMLDDIAFDDSTFEPLCIGFLAKASRLYEPKAAELVEKWSTSDSPRLRERAAETLEAIRMRRHIQTQSRELLLQLADGTITPDDLLPKPVPWVWENGKYVQK